MRSSVIVFIFIAIAAGGRPCLALSILLASQWILYDGIYGRQMMPAARPDDNVQPPPVVVIAPSCRCWQWRHPWLAIALSQRHGAVPHDLKEMEEQRWELGEWMTLTGTTTATAGDPLRMLVCVPMPLVRYRTNLDFLGINLPP
jgi:hypothetical protein